MKLNVLTQSQRDPKWGSILLGYNTQSAYTIYNYGCLITTLGNYIGKQPDEVNTILKDNKGFDAQWNVDGTIKTGTGTGNFVWSKSTVLGLNQTYISSYYNDAVSTQGITKIKELINSGYPLVCEVDFNPADTIKQQHFVLLAGTDGENILVVDPWEGQWETWSEAACKRNIYQFRAYDKKLPLLIQEDPLGECRVARDSHWNDLIAIKDALVVIGEYALKPILDRIDSLSSTEREYGKQQTALDEANKKIRDLEAQMENFTKNYQKVVDENTELSSKVQKLGDEKNLLEQKLQDIKDGMEKPDWNGWELIWEGFKKLVGR